MPEPTIINPHDADFAAKLVAASLAIGYNPEVTTTLLTHAGVALELGSGTPRVRPANDGAAAWEPLETYMARRFPEFQAALKPTDADDAAERFIAQQRAAATKVKDPLEAAKNWRSA